MNNIIMILKINQDFPLNSDDPKYKAFSKEFSKELADEFGNNFTLLGNSYNAINVNLIDYIDIMKGTDYGFKIRIFNLYNFTNKIYNDNAAKIVKETSKVLKDENSSSEKMSESLAKLMKTLGKTAPWFTHIVSYVTLKYDYQLRNNLKLGAMLDINSSSNFLSLHGSSTLDFNYSIGTWAEYNPKTLSIELNDFNINNNLKSGLFFTQKFYEYDILLTNIVANKTLPKDFKVNTTSQNEFYDTHNTMLFTEWNFNMNFNDDSIYSWFINNINVTDIVKLTNYSFNFKNPYFEGSIHEYFGYLGKHNYTIIDNNLRLTLNKTININKDFSITIPLGFSLNFNFYGSHNNMLKDFIGENLVYSGKAFEPFIGLNVGIFGKSINFEYNRNGYRFRFISRF